IVDSAEEIENWINAISESVGMDFRLYYLSPTSNNLIGAIRYVLKDSPAEKAGLKRGDMFMTVNGEQLTDANYMTLLFTLKNYTLGLASFNGGAPAPNGKTVNLTAVLLQENPVYLDTVITINSTRIGYLLYNGFTASYDSVINSSYDIELNKAFGRFKSEGIQKLILDLRYNGGGSITTSQYLASMIYSTDTRKIFSISHYNDLLQAYLLQEYGEDVFNDYFYNTISATDKMPATAINSLGLDQVYIITTSETASASEMVINGLKPYITVVQVGSNTAGKYVGSITITDVDNNGNVNPNHTWAMQPIIVKISNSQNVSDFDDGLTPIISTREYASELLPFCDPEEPFFKACINHMQGLKSAPVSREADLRGFKSSDDFSPYARTIIMDNLLPGNLSWK
ncbi:peptidase S41, partial [bacterium]|nr:peptidase S41 [bacterium]